MRSISGVKPTGKIHLGNFFGAIKQFIETGTGYENFYFIADYHALTTNPKKEDLKRDSIDIAMDYLALGLDPNHSNIFLQSSLPQHCELQWILSNVTPLSLLMRGHAYKSSKDSNTNINMGLFNYPVLMASDILIYDADIVPVGKDQKQHVEFARDIAEKFNLTYGEGFKIPEAKILNETQTVVGIDGRKMSKSYGNTIKIFDEEKNIKKSIMGIVTDSKGVDETKNPANCNIFKIYSLFLNENEKEELERKYTEGGTGYGVLKKELFETLMEYFKKARIRRNELKNDREYVENILAKGKERAKSIANEKMSKIRELIGIKH